MAWSGAAVAVGRAVRRTVFGLPRPLRTRLAGAPVLRDGVRLDPDTRLFRRLTARLGSRRDAADLLSGRRQFVRDLARVLAPAGLDGVPARDLTVGGVPARSYTPPGTHDVLVFLHGGGFIEGCRDSVDGLCRFLAVRAGIRVLSIDYRLAPEHPYPAGLDDVVAALRSASDDRAPGERVVVGGVSAGANLALHASLTLARAGGPRADLVWALYPVTDIGRTGGSRETLGSGFGLTAEGIADVERLYLPGGDPGPTGPALVRAPDLAAMPPTYLATAGFDPLRDEGEELAQRLRDAGVRVTGRRFPDLEHGFAGLVAVSASARAALLEAVTALRDLPT
ncbi:alpha/beta hydrolase [Pseudonocardia nematodicida]|uniref:Alpha/beta hydrolase n=1 Tax=Pseudonocardia nematodicida TaxID=1206997 RepID=A0ABV1K401_9PSEU